MKYIVFDMEWNQPEKGNGKIINGMRLNGEIIQIGAVMLDENFNDIDDFDAMISPIHYKIMNQQVFELTHITQKDINHGGNFKDVIEHFFKWCGEDYTFCTWGPDDADILVENMRIHGLDYTNLPPFIDLQKVFSKQILKQDTQCSLLRALEILGEMAYEAHDALNDADNTVSVLWHLNMNADISDCICGKGYSDGTDYIRKDEFTLQAKDVSTALADMALKYFISPITGTRVLCSRWFEESPGRAVSMAEGIDGKAYFLSISLKRINGRYNAKRTVWVMNDDLRERYCNAANIQMEAC